MTVVEIEDGRDQVKYTLGRNRNRTSIENEMGAAVRRLGRIIASMFNKHRVSGQPPHRPYYYGGTQYNRWRGGSSPMDPDAPVLQPRTLGPTGRSSAASVNEPEPESQADVVGRPHR